MKRFVVVLIMVFSLSNYVNATTLSEPAYANMQRAMGGIMNEAAAARGFSLSDPRVYNTMYGMGTAATAAVATAGAGLLIGGTAPAWGTVLAVAAISGGVSYAVSLGADALYKWAFGTPAATPITITGPQTSNAGSLTIFPQGQGIQMNTGVANSINQPYTYITTNAPYYYTTTIYSTTVYTNPQAGTYTLWMTWTYNGTLYYVWTTPTTSSVSPCPAGYNYISALSQCQTTATQITTSLQTLTQAVNNLSTAEQAQAVNADAMAKMLNYLWQQAAAQPGYAGLPYPASNPVTTDEINNWYAANPTATPTVGGLVTAVPSGSNGFAPSTTQTTGTAIAPAISPNSPAATTPGGTTAEINLGSDPGTPSPTLEQTPTAPMILAPILALLPDLRSYAVPSHNGTCPTPSISLYGQTLTMSEQCTFVEQYRSIIYGAALAAFAIAALFILLGA